jgi:ABC-type multidrug transport system ATPase subunit
MTPLECAQALSQGHGLDEPSWNELVASFSLTPHLEKSLFMLSTGSKRKVWLAAALSCSLPLVLLDEPTAALDAVSIQALWKALGSIAAARHRIVVVATSEVPGNVLFSRRFDLPLGAT